MLGRRTLFLKMYPFLVSHDHGVLASRRLPSTLSTASCWSGSNGFPRASMGFSPSLWRTDSQVLAEPWLRPPADPWRRSPTRRKPARGRGRRGPGAVSSYQRARREVLHIAHLAVHPLPVVLEVRLQVLERVRGSPRSCVFSSSMNFWALSRSTSSSELLHGLQLRLQLLELLVLRLDDPSSACPAPPSPARERHHLPFGSPESALRGTISTKRLNTYTT